VSGPDAAPSGPSGPSAPPTSPPFRAVLLDDNPHDCAYFRFLLRRHPSITLVHEAVCLKQALEFISANRVDVLFLESDLDGRSILDECPLIPTSVKLIFLTRREFAAVRAFELDALDFLVKPLTSPRLNETIRRLLRIDWQRATPFPAPQASPARLPNNGTILIPFERGRRGASLNEISLIQAFGNYTRVTLDRGKNEIVLRSLAKWEQLLPMPPFLRVHRNTIVHSGKVLDLEDAGGGSVLRIEGHEEKIPVSRRCLPEVRQTLFAAH